MANRRLIAISAVGAALWCTVKMGSLVSIVMFKGGNSLDHPWQAAPLQGLVAGLTKGPAQGTTISRSSANRSAPNGRELTSPIQMLVSADTSSDPCEIRPWQKAERRERAKAWIF